MCREEVRLNRRLAGDLYLGVRSIVAGGRGFALSREDDPGALDYLVEMRRWDERDTLAATLARGELMREQVVAIARTLAAFHERARPVAAAGFPPLAVERRMTENFHELLAVVEQRGAVERVPALERFAHAFVVGRAQTIDARAAGARARGPRGPARRARDPRRGRRAGGRLHRVRRRAARARRRRRPRLPGDGSRRPRRGALAAPARGRVPRRRRRPRRGAADRLLRRPPGARAREGGAAARRPARPGQRGSRRCSAGGRRSATAKPARSRMPPTRSSCASAGRGRRSTRCRRRRTSCSEPTDRQSACSRT
jgi:hypothetical protein